MKSNFGLLKGKLVLFFLLGVVFVNIYVFLDPDFGWHLKFGELVLSSGIPTTDPFSYTMPSHAYVNHEWMHDVGLAYLYPFIGKIGLSLIYATVFGVILYVVGLPGRKVSNRHLFTAVVLMVGVALARYVGVRPQVISWLFFSILLYYLLDWDRWRRYRVGVPLLFALWANLHGGFAIGLFVVGLVVLVRTFRERKFLLVNYVIIATCLFVTLNSPYRFDLWGEVMSSATDFDLRWRIGEWKPLLFVLDFSLVALLPFSAALLLRYRKIFSLEEIVLYIVLFLAGLSSHRNIVYWVLVAGWVSYNGLVYLETEADRVAGARKRLVGVSGMFLGIVVFYVLMNLITQYQSSKSLAEYHYYPVGAVQ